MRVVKVALGYWYQRTTLHLAEIHDFLTGEPSPLDLDSHRLTHLREGLRIKSVTPDIGDLERLDVEFDEGINAKIYEDGLVVVTKKATNAQDGIDQLSSFFNGAFLPAMKYLFSLGAPVPKELIGTKTPTPVFLVVQNAAKSEAVDLFKKFHDSPSASIESDDVQILKGGNYYLINLRGKFEKDLHLIESLIFFKEFKAQLHHYLNAHRALWEKVEKIKEKGSIRGKEVADLRLELEGYKKTIDLIAGRIDQMGQYLPTRASIVSKNKWEGFLTGVLEFQYKNLEHTLGYVKSLWGMTAKYLDSAIQIFTEINQLSTKSSVQALTVITSIGVLSGVVGFVSRAELPQVTSAGLMYFGLLLIAAVLVNRILYFIYRFAKYKIKDSKLAKISSERKL